jgi:hypothetical protein
MKVYPSVAYASGSSVGQLELLVDTASVPKPNLVVLLAITFLFCRAASAQDRPVAPLRLGGVVPGSVRTSATESWGSYDFSVTNLSDRDRLARVLIFFSDQPDVQYGRDVWVPAHSALSSWLLVGPAPQSKLENARELQMLLYDRTDGKDRLLLPPGEERVRSRRVLYRRREPSSAILFNEGLPAEEALGQLPRPESRDDESMRLALGFRVACTLSAYVPRVDPGLLPPMAKAFDGIDHFILASNRIARDAAGMQALRQWVEQGGKVWVMLDRIDPEVLAPLLGDALDFQVVDRVGLTSFRVRHNSVGQHAGLEPPLQRHDRPVEFVRVLLPAHEQPKYLIDGWPVWFSRPIGRGKVVVSTLGPRGWFRERTNSDPKSPFPQRPSFPVPEPCLNDLAYELHHPTNAPPLSVDALQPLLTEEIGYSVVGRGTVVLVFGVLLLTVLVLGIVLRHARRPELLGWLAPAAALAAMSVFLVAGETSRRALSPTVAVGQVIDAVPGKEESSMQGLMAMFRPDSGAADFGATDGGFFEVNTAGLQGQTRRLILTDQDAWHWENVYLPAGVRLSRFQAALATAKPIAAVARFGPEGLEGRLETGPLEDVQDVLLTSPTGRNLAVQLSPDGTFRAGSRDVLPPEQFLARAVLTDRQQHRQSIYRQLLKPPGAEYLQGRNFLLAWTKPVDTHFRIDPNARLVGSALVIVPLRFEHSAPGQRVTIPAPFLPYQRFLDGVQTRPFLTGAQDIDMDLRFQLPVEVLPFQIERAHFLVKIDAPTRRVTLSGQDGKQFIEIHRVDSPLDPIRLDLDARFLHLDEGGGLHVKINVSGTKQDELRGRDSQAERWTIDRIELEISGHSDNP